MRPQPRPRTVPGLSGTSVIALLALGLVIAACSGGGQPQPGGPQAVIGSPTEGSFTVGTFVFSVQPLDPSQVASVAFDAGGTQVDVSKHGAGAFGVFVYAPDHAAGPLTLRAVVTGKDGRTTTLTRTVQNVPEPPSSATVGAGGAALGTYEADGSLSTLTIPAGSALGANVEFAARTKEEVKVKTGVDYDALGITFLGAQDILTVEALDRTPTVSSGGFGPLVQPDQAVVNYLIGPDADGDGVGEIVVVNTASVAPNGDVVSDPVPVAQVGAVATTVQAGRMALVPLSAGLSGPPGTVIELPVAGFNASSPFGNVAVFARGGSSYERVGRVYTSETGAQTFFTQVPTVPAGTYTLTLRNVGTGYESDPIDVVVAPVPAFSGAPAARIEATLDLLVEALEALDAALAGTGAEPLTPHGMRFATELRTTVTSLVESDRAVDREALATMAAKIVASGVEQVLIGVRDRALAKDGLRATQQGKCNDILDRADRGMDMVNNLNSLGDFQDPAGKPMGDIRSFMFGEWWKAIKNATLDIDQALGGNACRPPPPGPGGPGGRGMTPSGMGAAVPAGGNLGGGAMPPGYRPIPDYGSSLQPAATAVEPGRFVVRVAATGSPVPFSGNTDAGGYFMVPMVPVGQPFVAVAIDTLTGQNRVLEGVGPAVGEGRYLVFDFSEGDSEVREARWDGGGDGRRWLDASNWEGDLLPLPNSHVIIESAAHVELDNASGDPYRVTIHDLTLAPTATLELSRGTLEVSSPATLEGDLLLTNGTIKPLADLTMNGDTTWFSGEIAGSGTFVNRGNMTVDSEPITNPRYVSGRLRNEGTVVVRGNRTGGLTSQLGGSLVNAAGATFVVEGVSAIENRGGPYDPAFDNHGTLRKTGEGESRWTVDVNHLGGTVEVDGGTLWLWRGSDSTGGEWQVAAGAALELGSNTFVSTLAGAYSGDGEGVVRLWGGERFLVPEGGASFDFPVGGLEWKGAILDAAGTLTNLGILHMVRDGQLRLAGHLVNEGTLVLRGAATSGGLLSEDGPTIENRAGATFEFHGDHGIANATPPLALVNDGALTRNGAGSSVLNVCYAGGGTIAAGITVSQPAACGP